MPNRLIILVPLTLLAPVLRAQSAADARWVAHCQDRSGDRQVKHCEVRVVTLAKGGIITVDPGENGGVTVEGWSRDSVEVHARIETQGITDDDAAALARDIKVLASGSRIGAEGPASGHRRSWSVSFVIFVPHHSDLKLDTANGPIGVRNETGRMTLTAYNGPVSLESVGGDVRARTTNGSIDVELSGDRWDGAGLDAGTTNGPLELAIPENYSARLEFGTVNGPMSLGFPLTVTIQGKVGRRITTTLGAGGAPVRAVTTNGPVAIRRN